MNDSAARVAPEKQVSNVCLPAVLSLKDVSTLETSMAKKEYWELLKDPRWQRKRLERLQLAEFRCEGCETTEKTLHVHHKLYRKGAMPWEYQDQDLEVLCEDCHEGTHHLRDRLKEALARLETWDLFRVLGYAEGLQMWGNDPSLRLLLENYEHASGVSDVIAPPMSTVELMDMKDADGYITSAQLLTLYQLRKSGQKS